MDKGFCDGWTKVFVMDGQRFLWRMDKGFCDGWTKVFVVDGQRFLWWANLMDRAIEFTGSDNFGR